MRRALRKRRVFDFVPSYLNCCVRGPCAIDCGHLQHAYAVHIHSHCSMFSHDDARLSQAYWYVGASSWLQKVASAQQIAESLDDVFSLSSFRNAQWNQWLSPKVQVQPVLCCVLACGRSLRFRQGKKQPVCRLCRKALVACLQSGNSEQISEASLWCTCNPVAS